MYVQKQAAESKPNTQQQNLVPSEVKPEPTQKKPAEPQKADTKKEAPEVSLKQVTVADKKDFNQKDYDRLLREKNQMQRHYDGVIADLQASLKTEQSKNSSQKQEIAQLFEEIAQIRDSVEANAPASAGNERELQAQLVAVQDQLNTQVAVNKSLTTKVLNFEKQISEQTRRTQELERKLAQAGGSSAAADNGVASVQQKLNELKNRVSGLQ